MAEHTSGRSFQTIGASDAKLRLRCLEDLYTDETMCGTSSITYWLDLCASIVHYISRFIYLGFYVTFNTVQVISQWVVGRAEEASTYSWSRFCAINCRPTASNYQLSHLRSDQEPNPDFRGGRRECYRGPLISRFKNRFKIFRIAIL